MAEPATASEPKLFIAVCIQTFETENTTPCNPAGTPILITFINSLFFIFNLLSLNLIVSSSFIRKYIIRTALTPSAITVAIATPATLNLNTITNNKLRQAFITPDIIRQYRGLFVSPLLLKTAAPKLYIIKNGIPKK